MTDRRSARAGVLRAVGRTPELEEVVVDAPRAGEVRVAIRAAGVCVTDLAAIAGEVPLPLPAVLGHEGAGVVEAVGPGVSGIATGDHVALSFDSCGACRPCGRGRSAYCERFHALNHSGLRHDGSTAMDEVHGSFMGQSSFATLALASARSAVPMPREVPFERLAPLGCSVQTGAGAVWNVLHPEAGDALAVFGCGAVGLAAVMAARAAGCDPVVAVDPLPARRRIAVELGADAKAPGERVPRVDFALDAVGSAEVVRAALGVLRSPGACATVGFRGVPNPVEIDQGRLLFGRSLIGVIEGDADPGVFLPRLLGLDVERLVTPFAFDDLGAALAAAAAGDVVKPVLVV